MILYVDETENDQYFIVCGLLLESEAVAEEIYKRFKNKLRNVKISKKKKVSVFKEFKSTLIDLNYKKIKFVMLETIGEYNNSILYSIYIKKEKNINDKTKISFNNYYSKIEKNIKEVY